MKLAFERRPGRRGAVGGSLDAAHVAQLRLRHRPDDDAAACHRCHNEQCSSAPPPRCLVLPSAVPDRHPTCARRCLSSPVHAGPNADNTKRRKEAPPDAGRIRPRCHGWGRRGAKRRRTRRAAGHRRSRDQTAAAAALEATLRELEEQRRLASAAVARYRDAALAAEPELPPDLVTGETLEEVDASLAAARRAVAQIRERLATESQDSQPLRTRLPHRRTRSPRPLHRGHVGGGEDRARTGAAGAVNFEEFCLPAHPEPVEGRALAATKWRPRRSRVRPLAPSSSPHGAMGSGAK